MVKYWRLVLGSGMLVASAIGGCDTPDKRQGGDARTSQTQSALTTALFQPYVAYPTGSRPEAVAIGDLDGDGRNDVALVTSFFADAANDYMVHVFLQDADGSLKPRVRYPVGMRSSSIDIGDVNGDGRADVIVGLGNSGGSHIGVLLQNASGTLDSMQSFPTVNSVQIKVGDFNADGRTDIAGINHGAQGDGLDLFLQTETGTLAPAITYHVPRGGRDELDTGDIDGDGRTDLVVMSGQGFALPDLNVLLQTPGGAFAAPTPYSLSGNTLASGVALGDCNGDGRSDIVVSGGGFIARFLQNADGTMAPAVSYASQGGSSAIVLADVDGDGRKDVLVTHNSFARLGVFRQYPFGDFVSEELFAIPDASQYQPQGLAVGDINGDGRPDAVIADSDDGLVVLRHVPDVSLALVVTSPVGGPIYVGTPLTVRWSVGDTVAITGFDVSAFSSGGIYAPIAGCTDLPPTARECPFTPLGPPPFGSRVRVTARDNTGQTVSAETTFNLTTPTIGVTTPVSPRFVGTDLIISWAHTLPASDTVRIELSRDGGGSYETLAAALPITNVGTSGTFTWRVTGPATDAARVRVTANGSIPASGSTNNFTIVAPTLTITTPTAGATVYSTSPVSVAWTHNVPGASTVRIEISRDGGSTFQIIAASAPNVGTFSAWTSGPDTNDARIRITTNGLVTAIGTSPNFKLVAATLAITSPVADAMVHVGTPMVITWSTNLPVSEPVVISLSRNGGITYYESLAVNAPNTGSFTWVVTGPPAAARVQIVVGATSTTSDIFAISVPSLTITGPAAGSQVYAGAPLLITWSSNLPALSLVSVELSRDGGSTFEVLAAAAPNTGSFAWVASGPESIAVHARVTASDLPAASSTSGPFAIVSPSLTVTGPAAGTLASAGTPVTITWTADFFDGDPVLIELSRDGGTSFELLAEVPNIGSFVWTAFGPETAEACVRVTSTGGVSASDVGPPFHIVVPTLVVTSPTAGASWAIGTARTLSWSSSNLPADVTVVVELSRDGGSSWTTLASGVPASSSLPWTATAPATTSALVRVSADGGVAIGTSGTFAIGGPAVAVTSPAAGASWTIGTAQVIKWDTNLLPSATVKVQLSRNGGSTYTTLNAAAPNTGSFAWTATGSASTTAIVRVVANGFAVNGVSGTFSLVAGNVMVTSPTTAITWSTGTVQAITWIHNFGADAQFKIEVSRSGVWSLITEAVPGGGATAGSYDWTVIGPTTNKAKIRVTWTGPTAAKDTSDVNFRIN